MAGIIEWVPVPSSWITDNRMHISVSRGTLVPTVDLKRRPNVAMRPGAVTPSIFTSPEGLSVGDMDGSDPRSAPESEASLGVSAASPNAYGWRGGGVACAQQPSAKIHDAYTPPGAQHTTLAPPPNATSACDRLAALADAATACLPEARGAQGGRGVWKPPFADGAAALVHAADAQSLMGGHVGYDQRGDERLSLGAAGIRCPPGAHAPPEQMSSLPPMGYVAPGRAALPPPRQAPMYHPATVMHAPAPAALAPGHHVLPPPLPHYAQPPPAYRPPAPPTQPLVYKAPLAPYSAPRPAPFPTSQPAAYPGAQPLAYKAVPPAPPLPVAAADGQSMLRATSYPEHAAGANIQPSVWSTVPLPLNAGQRVGIRHHGEPVSTLHCGRVLQARWQAGSRPGEMVCAFCVQYDRGEAYWHWIGCQEVVLLPD